MPPLYRLSAGNTSVYARDDAHKDELMKTVFKGKSKVDISRFKGLGEMPAPQLKETTMNHLTRSLIRVNLPDAMAALGLTAETALGENTEERGSRKQLDDLIERLMGRNAEGRFTFIQENAQFVTDIDV
jgi:topoisomerase-4 subunit B